jgi:sugar (pentulose or hexulose) kinase
MSASSSATDPRCVVAVDIGTQTTRAALVSTRGEVLDVAATPVELFTPAPGWAEQRPDDWWNATVRNLSTLLGRNPGRRVLAVAVGAAMHSVVPVGEDGRSLAERVGIWSDKRGAAIADALGARADAADLVRLAGNAPGPAWPGIKIAWYARHQPEVYRQARAFLVTKDYLNFRLTGVLATDPTEASGSFLYDAASGGWSDVLCAAVGVDRAKLPGLVASSETIGGITAEAGVATGLPAGTPVVAGAGDMLCQLAATGLHAPGRVTEISGTASIIAGYGDAPHPDPRVMNLRAAGEGWVHFGIGDAGGVCMRWIADELCEGAGEEARSSGVSRYDVLTALAGTVPAGSDGLLFLPYLLGERTLGTPHARGAFIGLTPGHNRAALVRSVMEGICYDLRMALDLFQPDRASALLRVTGGGATSPLWNRIRADLYGMPVATLATSEGGIVGAAILALVGVGCYGSVVEAAEQIVAESGRYEPGEDAAAYGPAYERFRVVHDALTPVWKAHAS